MIPEKYYAIPFKEELLFNDNWLPSDFDKTIMPIESIREQEALYAKNEESVLFTGLYVSYDSCDCGDGYGCSHGSWPFEIKTGDKEASIMYEDKNLTFEKGKNYISLPLEGLTIGDFLRACELTGIEVNLKQSLTHA